MQNYIFDYHPSFCREYKKIFRQCPSFKDDFKIFQQAITADLYLFNLKLPKKYIQVPKLGAMVNLPVFKFKGFYREKGDGSDFRIIFII